jgi:hypothetical protein
MMLYPSELKFGQKETRSVRLRPQMCDIKCSFHGSFCRFGSNRSKWVHHSLDNKLLSLYGFLLCK